MQIALCFGTYRKQEIPRIFTTISEIKLIPKWQLKFYACYLHHSILEYCEFLMLSEYPKYEALSCVININLSGTKLPMSLPAPELFFHI